MWRHVILMLLGVLLGLLVGAAMDISAEPSEDLVVLAAEAGVDPVHLEGAVTTTQLEPRTYLQMTGELSRPRATAPALNMAVERRLDCISWYESKHTPSARNRSSGAAGQYQFLPSTFATTPQGKAGLSPYDPVAARAAARWMIAQGRVREWVPVQRGLC